MLGSLCNLELRDGKSFCRHCRLGVKGNCHKGFFLDFLGGIHLEHADVVHEFGICAETEGNRVFRLCERDGNLLLEGNIVHLCAEDGLVLLAAFEGVDSGNLYLCSSLL